MVSASFWTNASYEQFKSLVLESQRPYASSKKNNLPPITYCFFRKLIAFKCSSTAPITLSS